MKTNMMGATPDAGGTRLRAALPALVATVLFAAMAALRIAGATHLYTTILEYWGFSAFRFPFLDTDTVLSALRCLRRGVDVFKVNPCDAMGRVYDYSPLWLSGAAFPVTTAWITPVGLVVDALFFASLLLVPAGRSRGAVALIVLAAVSSSSAYAVERGNNDLVIFALTAFAAATMGRSPRLRWAGYGAALLAGLLKYFPMTLMALALRERLPRFRAVAGASCVVVALFLFFAGHDLVRALSLIPYGSYFGDMFGARAFPGGVSRAFGLSNAGRLALQWLMMISAGWIGIRRGLQDGFRADIERLTVGESDFLFAGSLVVLGCFLTAPNIGYRAVLLVLVVPGLTALANLPRPGARHRGYSSIAVALTWILSVRVILPEIAAIYGDTARLYAELIGWLLRETLWWTLVPTLIACVTALVARTEMARLAVSMAVGRGPDARSALA